MKKILIYVLAFISAILISFALIKTLQFTTYKKSLIQTEFKNAQEKTKQTAQKVSYFIDTLEPLVTNLAKFTSTQPTTEQIKKELEKKPVEVAGVGVVTNTINLYYVEKEDQQQFVELPQNFIKEIKTEQTTFLEPKKDPITGELIIVYTAPVYAQGKEPIGTAFATQSLSHIKHVLATTYLGAEGYWFIVNENGTILSHPKSSLVKEKKNIKDFSASIEYKNEITGSPSWLFKQPITNTPWSLVGVFDKQELPIDKDSLRQKLFCIIILLLLGALTACLIPALIYLQKNKMIWFSSITATLVLLLTLISLWLVTNLFPDYKETLEPIKTKAYLYSQLSGYEHNATPVPENEIDQLHWFLQYRYKKGKFVPTGILVNDINFVGKEQIEFVGLVWQRYFDGIHDDVSRGFLLPQAAGKPDIVEISRTKEHKTETIQWLVRAKLNQDISYKKYPFDFKDLEIQFWHKDFEKNIILVPDLDSYKVINPNSLPGISKTVFMPGWKLTGTFFGLRKEFYNTTFGMYRYGPFGIYKETEKSDSPDLYFNITAKRKLINAIMIDMLTILVILFILFIILLNHRSLKISWTIGSASTAFFSTILAQMRFRNTIPTNELVYFEAFYFLIYAIILLVLITCLFDLKNYFTSGWLKDGFIVQVLFWPFYLMCMVLITLYYLY